VEKVCLEHVCSQHVHRNLGIRPELAFVRYEP